MPCARSRSGSTTIVYCLTKPPTLATSATPSALESGKADHPVLQRAQFRERHLLGDDRILIDPADTGRVRTERRRDAGRQTLGRGIEIFEHAASRPIGIGAVLEDDVDEGDAEEGEAAHHLRPRHGQHRRRQRIGDLIFDDLRRLPRIFRVDDDLDIGEIGNGVERQCMKRIETCANGESGPDENQDEIAGGPGDKTCDHRFTSGGGHALQRCLQIAFGIDQEVCGDHDAIALGHAVTDLGESFATHADLHFAWFEPSFAAIEYDDLPCTRVDDGAVGHGDDFSCWSRVDVDVGIHVGPKQTIMD